jgi:DNA repair photolyase
VTVNIAPLVLGLGDRDVPTILEEAAAAGARGASLIPLRLPGAVKEVFTERLKAGFPLAADVKKGDGHQLVNRGSVPVVYLEVSNRDPRDQGYYSDVDLHFHGANAPVRFTRKDGTGF